MRLNFEEFVSRIRFGARRGRRRGGHFVNDDCTFLKDARLPIGNCYFEGSYFDWVSRGLRELFGLSSNPAPKIDLPLGDLEGRLDKEPAKNVKTASRENARQRGRLINMRYNLAFDAKSMGDSAKK